jgi:transcriptional regulator with XRE-family HTH domain
MTRDQEKKVPQPSPKHDHAARPLGDLLRTWRDARGLSQLALSLEAGISQRQISFIESGRSVPSRETLGILAQALDVPLRERNALFLAAGYAPMFSDSPWGENEMDVVLHAVDCMLKQHEPFPAFALDRYWNVLATNDAAPRVFGQFVDLAAWPKPRNLLRMMFDPRGMRPFVEGWDDVAASLLERVRREALGFPIDPKTQALLDELRAAQGDAQRPSALNDTPGVDLPVVPIRLRLDGEVFSYFSMITTVAAPRGVAAQELRLECMFPADDATRKAHLQRFAPPMQAA